MNDQAFITTMGFDVYWQAFHYLLKSGFQEIWDIVPIPCQDVSNDGKPQLGKQSLGAAGALGLIFHFLTSAMTEVSLQQIFALIPTTVSHYLDFSLDILFTALSKLPNIAIHFPTQQEIKAYNAVIYTHHPHLVGGFGSIDGLSFPCQSADDPEMENTIYNGWQSAHFITNILIFFPQGLYNIPLSLLNFKQSWQDLSFLLFSMLLAVGMTPIQPTQSMSSCKTRYLKDLSYCRLCRLLWNSPHYRKDWSIIEKWCMSPWWWD